MLSLICHQLLFLPIWESCFTFLFMQHLIWSADQSARSILLANQILRWFLAGRRNHHLVLYCCSGASEPPGWLHLTFWLSGEGEFLLVILCQGKTNSFLLSNHHCCQDLEDRSFLSSQTKWAEQCIKWFSVASRKSSSLQLNTEHSA